MSDVSSSDDDAPIAPRKIRSKTRHRPSDSSSPNEKTTIIKTTKRSKKKITEIQTHTTTTITTTTKSKKTPTKRVRKTYKKAGQKKDTPGEVCK